MILHHLAIGGFALLHHHHPLKRKGGGWCSGLLHLQHLAPLRGVAGVAKQTAKGTTAADDRSGTADPTQERRQGGTALFRFHPNGRGQKARVALVDQASLAAARKQLEEALGQLASFEIVAGENSKPASAKAGANR